MKSLIDEKLKEPLTDNDKKELNSLGNRIIEKRYQIGILTSDPTEIMNTIKVATFVDRKDMNPDTHVPLLHGLLNLKTWNVEPFPPSKFYTWKVLGD